MQPARQHSQNAVYAANQSRNRRKKARRRRRTTFLVMLISVGVLFAVALLVTSLGKGDAKAPSSAAIVPSASAEAPASAAVSIGLDVPSLPSRIPTAYDEDATPALYNYNHYIPDEYTMDLVSIGGGQQMDARAAAAYNDMSAAAAAEGITLVPLSGYRTHERQTNNYNASIQRYLDRGLSHDEAVLRTEGYYAIPGTSEHEAGVAIDIGDASAAGANIDDSFADTKAYAWLQENCNKYGFILRYKEEDFTVTRIHSEAWHYRYVGANHAETITQRGVTLEEYILGAEETEKMRQENEARDAAGKPVGVSSGGGAA